ncbi:MAG: hypothetical protein H6713_01390 [Myxococcales bacterium]|nr:hypothetical protein [Myxococcales bacterium]
MQAREPVRGHLEAYWEQGWEGRIEYAFMPDGGRGIHALVWLRDGDELTIFEADGLRVRWSGTLRLVRRGWLSRPPPELKTWNGLTQRGVPYASWLRWFCERPPLPAAHARPPG